jgi:hypothetical protein
MCSSSDGRTDWVILHKCLTRNIFRAEFGREIVLVEDDLEGDEVGDGNSSDSQPDVGLG